MSLLDRDASNWTLRNYIDALLAWMGGNLSHGFDPTCIPKLFANEVHAKRRQCRDRIVFKRALKEKNTSNIVTMFTERRKAFLKSCSETRVSGSEHIPVTTHPKKAGLAAESQQTDEFRTPTCAVGSKRKSAEEEDAPAFKKQRAVSVDMVAQGPAYMSDEDVECEIEDEVQTCDLLSRKLFPLDGNRSRIAAMVENFFDIPENVTKATGCKALIQCRILDFLPPHAGVPVSTLAKYCSPAEVIGEENAKRIRDESASWRKNNLRILAPITSFLDMVPLISNEKLFRLIEKSCFEGYWNTAREIKKESENSTLPGPGLVPASADLELTELPRPFLEYFFRIAQHSIKIISLNSIERDFDAKLHIPAFQVLDSVVRQFYGEKESLASRDRRTESRRARTELPEGKFIKGQLCDFLMTMPDEAAQEAVGVEVSAVANASGLHSSKRKFFDDRKSLAILLRDMHIAIVQRVKRVRGSDPSAAAVYSNLGLPGFVVADYGYEIIEVKHRCEGVYTVETIASFNAPSRLSRNFGRVLSTFVRRMMEAEHYVKLVVEAIETLLNPDYPLDELQKTFGGRNRYEEPKPGDT
ncbi:hypothetical protein DFJ73DRAFT_834751 [Zopfochytrium polystomum]|nr:hypothetical protein DFJ73DRAFT_834751 [Zopfochytrium polystomum]